MPPDPRPNNKRHQKPVRQHLRTHGTAAEAVLWRHLQRRQLRGYKFRRQFGVGPYVLDDAEAVAAVIAAALPEYGAARRSAKKP